MHMSFRHSAILELPTFLPWLNGPKCKWNLHGNLLAYDDLKTIVFLSDRFFIQSRPYEIVQFPNVRSEIVWMRAIAHRNSRNRLIGFAAGVYNNNKNSIKGNYYYLMTCSQFRFHQYPRKSSIYFHWSTETKRKRQQMIQVAKLGISVSDRFRGGKTIKKCKQSIQLNERPP